MSLFNPFCSLVAMIIERKGYTCKIRTKQEKKVFNTFALVMNS